jgi:hypothetical protein
MDLKYCEEEQNPVSQTKQFRKDLDEVLQRLKLASDARNPFEGLPESVVPDGIRASSERTLAVTKVQEAIMWLGMDLKAQKEEGAGGCENPYPESYNPASQTIEPTADRLTM